MFPAGSRGVMPPRCGAVVGIVFGGIRAKNNTWKWTLCLLALCFVAALFLLPGPAEAAAIVDSGQCGDDLTWTLDSDGVLTVEGTGTMWEYSSQLDYDSWTFSTTAPWSGQFGSLKTLVIGSGVTSIGDYAFDGCDLLRDIWYGGTEEEWGRISVYGANDPLRNADVHFLKTVQQIDNEELASTVTTVQDAPDPSGFAAFTVTAEVEFEEGLIPEGTAVRALCVLTKGGRFVDVRIVEMEEGETEAGFHFDDVDYDTVRLFFTDEDSAPLCGALTLN